MTRKRLISLLLSRLEIPTLILVIAIVIVGFAVFSTSAWWLPVECVLIGSTGMAWGIKTGRRIELRAVEAALDELHRDFVLSMAPQMLASLPDEEELEAHDAPDDLREHVRQTRAEMQAALRAVNEAQAHEH